MKDFFDTIISEFLSNDEKTEDKDIYIKEKFEEYIKDNYFSISDTFIDKAKKFIIQNQNENKELYDIYEGIIAAIVRQKKIIRKQQDFNNYQLKLPSIANQSPKEIIEELISKKIQVSFHEKPLFYENIFSDLFVDYLDRKGVVNLVKYYNYHNMNDIAQQFQPIHPVLLCSALSVFYVTNSDYNDILKKYIFSFQTDCEDLIDIYLHFELEQLVEIHEIEKKFIRALYELGLDGLILHGPLKKLATIWHKRLMIWYMVNPAFLAKEQFIKKSGLMTVNVYSLSLNDVVHSYRVKNEQLIENAKHQFNEITISGNKEGVKNVLTKLKVGNLAKERAKELYYLLPHEIGAYHGELSITYNKLRDRASKFIKECLEEKEKILSGEYKVSEEIINRLKNSTPDETAQFFEEYYVNDLKKEVLSHEELKEIGYKSTFEITTSQYGLYHYFLSQ